MGRGTVKTRSAATAIPRALAALPSRYLALMGEFPLRPIRGEAEYERAAGIVHPAMRAVQGGRQRVPAAGPRPSRDGAAHRAPPAFSRDR
jgi:hypothetical protein